MLHNIYTKAKYYFTSLNDFLSVNFFFKFMIKTINDCTHSKGSKTVQDWMN